jgi:hypothetical protein
MPTLKPDAEHTRRPSTAEREAMTVLQEVRRHGGYVLLDLQGNIHVRHIARVPVELRCRIARYYPEVVQLLLDSVE